MNRSRPLLLIEDDQIDAMTVKRALGELGLGDCIVHLSDGAEALEYLRSNPTGLPRLILLDLNMPRMNGLEFLRELKADQNLRRVPVVVLTTSKEDADVSGTFQCGVAGYMVKPLDYADFVRVMQAVTQYWDLSAVPVKA